MSESEINQLFPIEHHKTAYHNHLVDARLSIPDPNPRRFKKNDDPEGEEHMNRFRKVAGAGKRVVPVAIAGGVLYLGTGVPVGAVEPPDCPTTCIYDANDPLEGPGYPTAGNSYVLLLEGGEVPINIKGYNEDFNIRVIDQNGVIGNPVNYHASGDLNDTITYPIPAHTPTGFIPCFIQMDTGIYGEENWQDVDAFQLAWAEPEDPIPEAPTWVLIASGLAVLAGYLGLQKKRQKE